MRRVDRRCGIAPRRVHAHLKVDVTDGGAHALRVDAIMTASSASGSAESAIGPPPEGFAVRRLTATQTAPTRPRLGGRHL
jgi:hypothetical protein